MIERKNSKGEAWSPKPWSLAPELDPALPAMAGRKLKWKTMSRAEQLAHVAAWRARHAGPYRKWVADWQRLCELGLVPGFPNRLAQATGPLAETMLSRARREIAWMEDLDRKYEIFRAEQDARGQLMGPAPAGEAFRELTQQSMGVFKKILTADVPFCEDNVKLIREQREAAAVTIRIGARVALEMYKGQHVGALAALLERLKTIDLSVDGDERAERVASESEPCAD